MSSQTFYATGTVSVNNGATAVRGSGTGWGDDVLLAGDLFMDPAQPLIPPQRIASVTDATHLVLAYPWPGTSMTLDPYEVRFVGFVERSTAQTRRYLERLGKVSNTGIAIDAFGDFADRDAFDDEAVNFAYLSLDGDGGTITEAVVFLKASGASADWSDAVLVTGPPGDDGTDGVDGTDGAAGPIGPSGIAGIWRGPYAGGTAYVANDIVQDSGSSWIAKTPTTGHAPPDHPDHLEHLVGFACAKGRRRRRHRRCDGSSEFGGSADPDVRRHDRKATSG